jgi:hypothetical protein
MPTETGQPQPQPQLRAGTQLLVSAAILAAFGVIVAGVIPVGIWTWAVTGVLFAVATIAVDKVTERGQEDGVTLSLLAVSFGLSMALFFYLACRYLARNWSLGLLPVVVVLVAVVSVGAIVLSFPKLRRVVLSDTGLLGPFAALALLFVVMTSVFAAVTVIAAKEKLVRLTGGSLESPSFEEVARLYLWHFSNAVPLLDINETLRWKVPLSYTSSRTGSLVLLYKIAVIIPTIGTFLFYWRQQTD